MAWAHVETETRSYTSSGSTETISWTHGAATDALVLVHIMADDNATISGVTFDGVSMTLLDTRTVSVVWDIWTFYLQAGDLSSQTINVVVSNSTGDDILVALQLYSGIDQVHTPLKFWNTGSLATSASSNATSSADDLVVDHLTITTASTGETAGAGQTERVNNNNMGGNLFEQLVSEENGASGTTTMSWSWTGSSNYAHIVGVFSPVIPDTTGTLAATLPSLTAALTGVEVTWTGTLAADLPALTSSLDGLVSPIGTLAASLPALTAALTGVEAAAVAGTLAGSLPSLTAAFTGVEVTWTGTLAGTLPALSASFSGEAVTWTGTLNATLPSLTGTLIGRSTQDFRVLYARMGLSTRILAAAIGQNTRTLYATMAQDTRSLTVSVGQNTRSLYVSMGQNTRNLDMEMAR